VPGDVSRRATGALLSLALTSFLTGVTEPIEFTFMFLAPGLYVLHAVLTGVSMVLMPALGAHLGFSFSAGLFDFVLNFPRATRPLLLLPVGAAYFALYYALFYYAIVRFHLATPGRDAADAAAPAPIAGERATRAEHYITALGGAANVTSIDACTTRLRLVLVDGARVDAAALARLGALGVVRPAPTVVLVLGPIADQVAAEVRRALRLPVTERGAAAQEITANAASAPDARFVAALSAALGGPGNVRQASTAAGRLRIELADASQIDREAIARCGARGVAVLAGGVLHVLIDDATTLAAALGKR
jgi:PTS system N-acetylglucosamine-specific IIC component